jgi:hypothetical protein
MERFTETNIRPYRIFIDGGKKTKGFYIMRKGKRQYIKNKAIKVNKRKIKKTKVSPKTLKKIINLNKKTVRDIAQNVENSKINKMVNETFKNISGQVNKIGDITNVYNIQRGLEDVKKELGKEQEQIHEVKDFVKKLKSDETGLEKLLKTEQGRKVYAEVVADPDIKPEELVSKTFKKFDEYIQEQGQKLDKGKKDLEETIEKLNETAQKNKIMEEGLISTKKKLRKKQVESVLHDEREKLEKMDPIDFTTKMASYLDRHAQQDLLHYKESRSKKKQILPPEELSQKRGFRKEDRGQLIEELVARRHLGFKDIAEQVLDLKVTPEVSKAVEKTLRGEEISGDGMAKLKGMSNYQIECIMQTFPKSRFVGAFPYDIFWHFLEEANIDDFSCIINSIESDATHIGHWMAFNLDKKTRSVEFFDSFGSTFSPGEMEKLTKFLYRISPEIKWKYKSNSIIQQADKTDTCGWFAVNFLLLRRVEEISFEDATGYSDIKSNEKQLNKLKRLFVFL